MNNEKLENTRKFIKNNLKKLEICGLKENNKLSLNDFDNVKLIYDTIYYLNNGKSEKRTVFYLVRGIEYRIVFDSCVRKDTKNESYCFIDIDEYYNLYLGLLTTQDNDNIKNGIEFFKSMNDSEKLSAFNNEETKKIAIEKAYELLINFLSTSAYYKCLNDSAYISLSKLENRIKNNKIIFNQIVFNPKKALKRIEEAKQIIRTSLIEKELCVQAFIVKKIIIENSKDKDVKQLIKTQI